MRINRQTHLTRLKAVMLIIWKFGNWHEMKKVVAGLTWLLSTTSLSELTHTYLGTELTQNTLLIVFIQVYTSVENAPEIHYTLQSSSCGSNHSTWNSEITAADTVKLHLLS